IDVSGDASPITTQVFPLALQEGEYTWSCYGCSVADGCNFAANNRTINVSNYILT
ncbi:unnamed protein product, partial [marine sediment metagenome]